LDSSVNNPIGNLFVILFSLNKVENRHIGAYLYLSQESPHCRQYAWRCKGSIRIPPPEAWFYWISKVVTAEPLAGAFGAAG
jgi:hypothetical protein